jgi:ADP-ribose pyrophosphatase YjhB (NUDIX family)
MATQKGGCILINKETKKIGLIYRPSLDDYSFPKGHMEFGESVLECAVRETIEETARDVKLIKNDPVCINKYQTSAGEDVECYMYLAEDLGDYKGEIAEKDREQCVWIDYDKVYDTLTYQDLKEAWKESENEVKAALGL